MTGRSEQCDGGVGEGGEEGRGMGGRAWWRQTGARGAGMIRVCVHDGAGEGETKEDDKEEDWWGVGG